MGDFYEAFDDDAARLAETLGIALTSRPLGKDEGRVPMAGIPHHALERYLDQLVTAGLRVALAEQVEPPGRGLVERRVLRVVTPGTVEGGALLPEGSHNWLVALAPEAAATGRARSSRDTERRWGLAACDATTGELECQLVAEGALGGELARLAARELLLPEGAAGALPEELAPEARRTTRPARAFAPAGAARALRERYGVASLDGFGLAGLDAAVGAAGALLGYLEESWPQALRQLRTPRTPRPGEFVALDAQTRRTLELFESAGGPEATLLGTVDRTLTGPGARLLRERLGRPLRDAAVAEARLDELAAWLGAPLARAALRRALRGLPDLERLLGRVRAGSAGPRQLLQLRRALERLPELAAQARAAGGAAAPIAADLGGTGETAGALAAALADDPPEAGEGESLRPGADAELDALRAVAADARGALAALEAAERERSGLRSLKVGYHRIFGYYLELPRSQSSQAPPEYEPRQTLANAQRYRYRPLSELEDRILGAKERLIEAEREALARLCEQVAAAGPAIERAAAAVGRLDVAAALAEIAADGGYTRPRLRPAGPIVIEDGRHPVVERRLEPGAFVPNDLSLGEGAGIILLTGPNMGGKSTYLRQTALIVLLAQCGSYVPAARAEVGMVDAIFTRVGAHDDLAGGRSTFMLEMVETAQILHRATERSLVLLDEIGRGTSTRDGLAIARAVVEALHHRPGGAPRTLFATHYRELTELAGLLPRVTNRAVAVAEQGGELVFLHRIEDGAADRAYGVHVAALAGLPRAVVSRARELLAQLEAAPQGADWAERPAAAAAEALPGEAQLPLLATPPDALTEELARLDPDELSPLEALQRLYELRAAARARLGVEG